MAFNENKRVEDDELTYEEASDVMRRISSLFGIEATEEDMKEAYQAHLGVEPEAEEVEEVIDLADMSLVEKLGAVCHSTLNEVLTGDLVIASADELKDLARAVAIREDLRDQYGE